MPIDEVSLLAIGFANKQRDALDAAYRQFADTLFSVALAALRAPDDAQDCVHDAVLRAWENKTYVPGRGALRSFLSVCVRNEALSRMRTSARRRSIETRMLEPERSMETDFGDPIETARVRRALLALPPEQRRALELAYIGGKTHREIAVELGEPLGTVKSRLALGLRRLGRELEGSVRV